MVKPRALFSQANCQGTHERGWTDFKERVGPWRHNVGNCPDFLSRGNCTMCHGVGQRLGQIVKLLIETHVEGFLDFTSMVINIDDVFRHGFISQELGLPSIIHSLPLPTSWGPNIYLAAEGPNFGQIGYAPSQNLVRSLLLKSESPSRQCGWKLYNHTKWWKAYGLRLGTRAAPDSIVRRALPDILVDAFDPAVLMCGVRSSGLDSVTVFLEDRVNFPRSTEAPALIHPHHFCCRGAWVTRQEPIQPLYRGVLAGTCLAEWGTAEVIDDSHRDPCPDPSTPLLLRRCMGDETGTNPTTLSGGSCWYMSG
jgi:hypothetical protein